MPTSSDRVTRRVSPPSQQRGAVGVFMIISLLLLVPILALAINIGQLYYAQRDLEKQATLAALSAVQVASGCANDGTPGLLAEVTAEVTRIIVINSNGDPATAAATVVTGINGFPGVEIGRIVSTSGLRVFSSLPENDPRITAVRVNLTRPQPTPFLIPFNAIFGGGLLYASATAQQAAQGFFNVGSGLLSVDGGLVNGLLGALLCAPGDAACQASIASLNVLDSRQGLIDTQVSLGELALALGVTVEDLSDPLTLAALTPVLPDVLGGLATSLGDGASDSVVALLQGLANAASNPNSVPIGQLLGAINGIGGDTPVVNLFDLLIALGQASVADPDGITPLPLDLDLDVPGVASVNTFLTVLEPPRLGMGRAGEAEARTSQIRLQVRVEAGTLLSGLQAAIEGLLSGLLNLLGTLLGLNTSVAILPTALNIGVDINVAGGAARLDQLRCPTSGSADPVASLSASTATATVAVGSFTGAAASAPALNTGSNSFPLARVSIDATCVGLRRPFGNCLGLNLGSTALNVGLGLTGVGVGATGFSPLAPVTEFTPSVPVNPRTPPIFNADGVSPNPPVAANPQTIASPTSVDLSLDLTSSQTGSGLVGILSGLVANLLTGITNLLDPLLDLVNGLATALIDPLLSLLGIQLGSATVTMTSVQTAQPILVSTCLPGTAACP
ncbi:pilus assembly protein TadG-related protein [Nevskia sp.]|uniref:pilus assembly protein TadG-related protein n=1 Tax=Nevskia sp. TaxID=1929292 RepID=UPI0025DEABFE|nr:pilus assembly protein TadG-related protein [Nevskia sp.]